MMTAYTDEQLKQAYDNKIKQAGPLKLKAAPIGTQLKKNTKTHKSHKLIQAGIECPHCKKLLGKQLVSEKSCPQGNVIIRDCEKYPCRWDRLSLKQKTNKLFCAGVGKLFVQNGQVPSIRTFPEKANELTGGSLYICGDYGTKKTWALAALVSDSLSQGIMAHMVNWQWLQLEVRDTYKSAATETEKDVLMRYAATVVLCIDDLGAGKEIAGKETEAARVLLYALLDWRYARGLVTHISSNLSPDELASRYDKRIARRIREMCKVVVLKNIPPAPDSRDDANCRSGAGGYLTKGKNDAESDT